MSLWDYNTEQPPAQAYEAVDATVALIKAGGLMVSGSFFLASTSDVHGHEEPADKPEPNRWVLVTEFQSLGGKAVTHDGLNKVILHVKVVGERDMPNYPAWHGAMHARIQRSIVGKVLTLTRGETGLRLRKLTEPSRPEYYKDTKTRESFMFYAITLQPNQAEE
jgi:hypothetical protein